MCCHYYSLGLSHKTSGTHTIVRLILVGQYLCFYNIYPPLIFVIIQTIPIWSQQLEIVSVVSGSQAPRPTKHGRLKACTTALIHRVQIRFLKHSLFALKALKCEQLRIEESERRTSAGIRTRHCTTLLSYYATFSKATCCCCRETSTVPSCRQSNSTTGFLFTSAKLVQHSGLQNNL